MTSCRQSPSLQRSSSGTISAAVSPVVDVRNVTRALSEREAAAYAGDAACASCHEAIYSAQSKSRHARTLKAVSKAEHGGYFAIGTKITDPLLGCTYDVGVNDGVCVMRGKRQNGGGILAADFVFGSGRTAHTYMCRITDNIWIDLRLSYYTAARKWDYTPMQKPGDRQFTRAAGIDQIGERLVQCISCHATVMRASATGTGAGILAEKSHFGIGCERCHGPGRLHAESARQAGDRGRTAVTHLENLKLAGQDRINGICGACHRTPLTARFGDPTTKNGIARFEGAALPRSACYQKSKTLTCTTCHDSHGDVDPSPERNDARCLGCHAKPPGVDASLKRETKKPDQTPVPKICSVNQKAGCVRCHMPAQRISTIPYAVYHNHWIKVWPKLPAS